MLFLSASFDTVLRSPYLKNMTQTVQTSEQETGQDIFLTSNAAKRVAAIAEKQAKPAILRLAVEGGGCSGFQYLSLIHI